MSGDRARRGESGPEAIEPELLPPEPGRDVGGEGRSLWRRLEDAFGPILAGMVIDLADAATFGRLGLVLGMVVGGTAAYWMASIYRLPIWQRFLWAVAAGLYCTFPGTEFIPLATLIAAFARFFRGGR